MELVLSLDVKRITVPPTEAQKGGLAGVLCGVGRKTVPRQEEGTPLLHLLTHAAARPRALCTVRQEVGEQRSADPATVSLLQQQQNHPLSILAYRATLVTGTEPSAQHTGTHSDLQQ
jgi:hypothetical protein